MTSLEAYQSFPLGEFKMAYIKVDWYNSSFDGCFTLRTISIRQVIELLNGITDETVVFQLS